MPKNLEHLAVLRGQEILDSWWYERQDIYEDEKYERLSEEDITDLIDLKPVVISAKLYKYLVSTKENSYEE